MNFLLGMCGIDFFYFGSVSVRFFKNSDSVWNEFGSGKKNAICFEYNSYLLLTQ